jgi:hypothetical protein
MRVEDRISALARIAAEVRNGEMPPRAYAMMHPLTHLSGEEQKDVLAWTKAERKRARAMSEEQTRSDGQ